MSEDGGHRRLTKAAAQDLVWLLIVLALIVVGMLAYRQTIGRDPEGKGERDWYYQHVAPNSRNARR